MYTEKNMFIKINILLNYAHSWLADMTYFYNYTKKYKHIK